MLLPLGDLARPRRAPWATLTLVAANVVVWTAYQLPHGIDGSVGSLGFRPCGVTGGCPDKGVPWFVEVFTSMFAHGSWSHLVGNMVFLLAFGPLVEGLFGRARYALTYIAAGIGAIALQAGLMLLFTVDETVPYIGASGAISGIVGAYVVARPFERVLVWLLPVLFLRIPALALGGVWFLLQAIEGAYSLSDPGAFVGIAFFAHVGGFLVGVAAATLVLPDAWTRAIRLVPHGTVRPVAR